jgi:hypothetical protein
MGEKIPIKDQCGKSELWGIACRDQTNGRFNDENRYASF